MMGKKLTIVKVLYARPHLGGSGKVGLEIGKELARRGHDVHIVSYPDTYLSEDESKLLKLHPVAEIGYDSFKVPPTGLIFPSTIRNLANELKIDILHAHYAIQHGEAVVDGRDIIKMDKHILKYDSDPKAIITCHGTDISINGYKSAIGPALRLKLSQADYLTFVSHELQDQAKKLFNFEKGKVINNFIDETEFKPDFDGSLRVKVREELGIPNDALVFYHTSNFRRVKNTPSIVEAFNVATKNPDFPETAQLLFFGTGPEKTQTQSLVSKYGLENRVKFTDVIQYELMPRYIHAGDIHLLPSLSEACPLVNLEAMAVMKPIIASNAGGIAEAVVHGLNGYLFELGDLDSFSNYMVELATDKNKRLSMGEEGYKILNFQERI